MNYNEQSTFHLLQYITFKKSLLMLSIYLSKILLMEFVTIFLADGRHGIVRVDRVPLACKLVDLPCILESLKTVDKKTFYKTADICQVRL